MQGFGKTKVTKKNFMMQKKTIKIRDVDRDNIVISKLIETKNIFNYLIGYLDEFIRPLVWILPKISEYVKK